MVATKDLVRLENVEVKIRFRYTIPDVVVKDNLKFNVVFVTNSSTALVLKVSKSRKKICCPRFLKKNAGAFLCTEKCPSVCFFGESRTTIFFLRFTDLYF